MINLRLFVFILLLSVNQLAAQNTNAQLPNIIVILIDDAGYADFGFMGSNDLKTPHIDQLASEGIIFTDAHVSATVCAPSRAGLITGRYQQEFGFEANHTGDAQSDELGLPADVKTIADVLKTRSYNTYAIGKWHLGHLEDDYPDQRGFDQFYGFLGGARSYFPLKNPNFNQTLRDNRKPVTFGGYLTDVITDKAISYIKTSKANPFFMYLAYNAVHTPMHAKKEHLEKFKGHPRKKLAAMTWSLDENIGRINACLKALDLDDNTIVFFLSDNGGAYSNLSSNAPLKGAKGNKFEGGHRVPFILKWPKKLPSGIRYHGLTSALDIFTTSIAAAGIKADKSWNLDGVDLTVSVLNKSLKPPHQYLFWRKLQEYAVRYNNYKLVGLKTYGSRVYNLTNDLGENKDLSNLEPKTSKNLIKAFRKWESTVTKPLWREGDAWESVTFHIQKQLMDNAEVKYRDPSAMKKYLKSQNQK